MTFGRYELKINDDKQGDFQTLDDVYLVLDWHYSQLPDQYAGEIYWRLEDLEPPIKIARHRMPASLWYAFAETPANFGRWLALFGWER